MITALFLITSIICIYFAITKFVGLCEKDGESSLESMAVAEINQELGGKHGFKCIKASIEPFNAIYDFMDGDAPVTVIIIATIDFDGVNKEYSVLIDGCEMDKVKNGLDTIITSIRKDIAALQITC